MTSATTYGYSINMPFINERDVSLVMDEFVRLLELNGFSEGDFDGSFYNAQDYFTTNTLTTNSFLSYYNKVKKKFDGNFVLDFRNNEMSICLKLFPNHDTWNNNKLIGYSIILSLVEFKK